MKFFRNINRYFRDARKSVMRNFYLSLASISCITITLIVVAFSAILSYNVENFAESIRKDVTVVIFLNSDTTETKRNEIEKEIRATKNVEELTTEINDPILEKYFVTPFYSAEDSQFNLTNCTAAADFLAAYLQTDPKLDKIKREYEEKIKEIKNK